MAPFPLPFSLLPQPLSEAVTQAYRAEVPLFVPAASLLCEWQRRGGVMPPALGLGAIAHGAQLADTGPGPEAQRFPADMANDARLRGSVASGPRAGLGPGGPNRTQAPRTCFEWASLLDPYTWPHVHTFDSWDALLQQLRSVEGLRRTSELMRGRNKEVRANLRRSWEAVLARALARRAAISRRDPEGNPLVGATA